jgi:hypothetical protein
LEPQKEEEILATETKETLGAFLSAGVAAADDDDDDDDDK